MNPCGPDPLMPGSVCSGGAMFPGPAMGPLIIHSPLMTAQQMLDMAYDADPGPQNRFDFIEPVKPLVDYTTITKPAIDYNATWMTKQNNINVGSLSSNPYSASDEAALSHFLWDVEDRDRQRR